MWKINVFVKHIDLSQSLDMLIGCKQDILYILVTLFSTWKHEKKKASNF
jgi:hypothetical protein